MHLREVDLNLEFIMSYHTRNLNHFPQEKDVQ